MGTQTLLDAARTVWADGRGGFRGRLLHVSTDEVYGSLPLERPDLLFTETTPITTSSPYSASKAAATCLSTPTITPSTSTSSPRGARTTLAPTSFPEKVIPLFITNLIEGKQVPLYGDGPECPRLAARR